MAAATGNRAFRIVKQHVPLIKFRKGGPYLQAAEHSKNAPSSPAAPSAIPSPGPAKTSATTKVPPVMEDWQLARRYQRKPLTAEEIEYINRGGPA